MIANNQIRSFVDRIEALESDKRDIAGDIKDVYAEAKGNGIDVKALHAVVRRRQQDKDKLAELEARIDEYMSALGGLADTPLGQAVIRRVENPDGLDIPEGLRRLPPPIDHGETPFS